MSIEIKNLTKTFDDGNEALKDVSITFKKNDTTGLIGFNGSGKTTTFNIIAGLMEATSGTVLFEGEEPSRETYGKISYLAAGAEPKNGTVAIKHLEAIAYFYGASKEWTKEKIEYYSSKMGFEEFLKKPIKSLSKGNQQKIKLIASFLNPNCEYMFLDEPFDGLDPIMVDQTVKLYKELKGITIIITSHRMEVVQNMTSEFYVLKDGDMVVSKRTDDKTIAITVNNKVKKTDIQKIKNISSIERKGDEWVIKAKDISEFKAINKKLQTLNGYVYSSLKSRNIAEEVFDEYVGGSNV